jgi:hypothetical protein
MTLTNVQMIGIGVVILVAIILSVLYFKEEEKFFFGAAPEFQEQSYCARVPGVDIVVYKTQDSQFPFKKVNTMNLQTIVQRLNDNVIAVRELQEKENKKLTRPGQNWSREAMVQFRNMMRAIKRDFNSISTQCRNMEDVYKTNGNVIVASKKEMDFLNNLDNYLNTVLYPFMVSVKLDDDDDMNNVYNVTVPKSFYEFNSSNESMNDYDSNQTRQVLRVSDKLWTQFIEKLDTFLNKYPDSGFVKFEFMRDY